MGILITKNHHIIIAHLIAKKSTVLCRNNAFAGDQEEIMFYVNNYID